MSEATTTVEIEYTNWRGQRDKRLIRPVRIAFENNEWHTETQWVLYAVDLKKREERAFAMKDIHSWSGL